MPTRKTAQPQTQTKQEPQEPSGRSGAYAKGKEIVARYERLKGRRADIEGDVQDILAYCQPQKAVINRETSPGVASWTSGLYDMTAYHANITLAAGLMSLATPHTSRWAALSSPRRTLQGRPISDRARKWYAESTEEVMDEIGRSNFYTELHECHLDRNSAGTSCLFHEPHPTGGINFTAFGWGSYVIAEDAFGMVDTLIRSMKLTVRQAVERWGADAMPPKIRECWGQAGEGKIDTEFEFLHAVYPRQVRDVTKSDGLNKRFASCYVAKDEAYLVDEGGFNTFPYAVSRYHKWPGTLWGFGPGFAVLPVARQVNFLERQMDTVAEKLARPPMLVPSYMEGDLDTRAGGTIVFNENYANVMPQLLQVAGDYAVGKDRVQDKRDFIERAFHNDLFRMFAQIERQMTAFEAMQRANEKLDLISPAFTRLTVEMLSPVIQAVFREKLTNGELPPPPEEILEPRTDGSFGLREPKVVYTSKLALAIRASEARAFLELQQILEGPMQVAPEIADNFVFDKVARLSAEAVGVSSEIIRNEEERDEMRQARAEQMAQQQAAQDAPGIAKAAKDMASVPEPMARRMAQAVAEAQN